MYQRRTGAMQIAEGKFIQLKGLGIHEIKESGSIETKIKITKKPSWSNIKLLPNNQKRIVIPAP